MQKNNRHWKTSWKSISFHICLKFSFFFSSFVWVLNNREGKLIIEYYSWKLCTLKQGYLTLFVFEPNCIDSTPVCTRTVLYYMRWFQVHLFKQAPLASRFEPRKKKAHQYCALYRGHVSAGLNRKCCHSIWTTDIVFFDSLLTNA